MIEQVDNSLIAALLYPIALVVLLIGVILRATRHSKFVSLNFTGLGIRVQFSTCPSSQLPKRRCTDVEGIGNGEASSCPGARGE